MQEEVHMQESHELAAEGLMLGYDGRRVVHDLSIRIPPGRITSIVGANACGKSTLLRALSRLLKPESGLVVLDGRDIAQIPTREVAKHVGILPQAPTAPESIVVSDLVGRGRYAYQRWYRQWALEDEEAVGHAMEATRVTDLSGRSIDELSGGQRQRVWIAMALAQGADIMLLDEPTTYLDIAHQVEVLELLAELNAREGRTIVLVLHDLNQACRYSDHLVAMREGRIHAQGRPIDIVDADLVREVFDLESQVVPDPVVGAPMIVPLAGRARLAGRFDRDASDDSQT
jgi:iron complex transport system ATP-binding protein